MNDYSINRPRLNKVSPSQMIDELKRVTEHYAFKKFTRHDFDKISKSVKGTAVLSYFGSWENALKSIEIELTPSKKDRAFIKNDDLFCEMDRIWKIVGHRPSKTEWENSSPKFSYTTYKIRLNGWVNACTKFIKWKGIESKTFPENTPKEKLPAKTKKIEKQDIRDIPLKLRLKVLSRDTYKCVLCGRSPASNPTIHLHIDHISPFAKGGKTVVENLQTLCNECNWGKGADKP